MNSVCSLALSHSMRHLFTLHMRLYGVAISFSNFVFPDHNPKKVWDLEVVSSSYVLQVYIQLPLSGSVNRKMQESSFQVV